MKKCYLWLSLLLLGNLAYSQNFAIDTVYFAFDRYTLTDESRETLDSLIVQFQDYPNYYVEIFGHTDSSGTDEYNLKLSELRAREVAVYLVDAGIQVERIMYEGLGTTKPAASNESYRGRRLNRRVDVGVVFTHDRVPLPEPPKDTVAEVVPVVTIDPASMTDTIYSDYAQFTIKANKRYRIIAPAGTEVLIPENSFNTEAEDLTVEFKELFKLSDMFRNEMPYMTSDGPLEIPGMMSLDIREDRRPVEMVEGAQLEVKLPTTRRDPNMMVYKGTGGNRGGRRRGRNSQDLDPAEDPGFSAVTRWIEQEGEVRYNGRDKRYLFNIPEPGRYAVGRMLYYQQNTERNDKGIELRVKFKGRRYPKATTAMLIGDAVKTAIPMRRESDRWYEVRKLKYVDDRSPITLFAVQYDDDGDPWVVNFRFKLEDYLKKGKRGGLPTAKLKVKFRKITEEELEEMFVDLDN